MPADRLQSELLRSTGVIQPVAGAIADRFGPAKVLIAALVLLSLGTGLTPFITSYFPCLSLGGLQVSSAGPDRM